MISLELHEKLMKKWAKVQSHAGVYQKIKRRHRLEFFMNFVHHFKGKNAIEIGCNAGLYGYEISQVAKSYIGIDRDIGEYYIKQAAITKNYMENSNVTFMRGNVKDFIKKDIAGEIPPYNALFASFVLYHLSEKETDRLAETVLPKCDVVIIPTRTKKRTPWKKYNPHKFNRPENVVKYLKKAGFECEVHWPDNKKYATIVALRKAVEEKIPAEKPQTVTKHPVDAPKKEAPPPNKIPEEKPQIITEEAVVLDKGVDKMVTVAKKEGKVQIVSSPTKTSEKKNEN